MGRVIEFLIAPFVLLAMLATLSLTVCFFCIGWCLGALVGGFRAGWRRNDTNR